MNFDPITRTYCSQAHRALSDTRELSFLQSRMSRDGEVATLEAAREAYAREQAQDHPTDFTHGYAELTGGF
jgi:hypothetical protein